MKMLNEDEIKKALPLLAKYKGYVLQDIIVLNSEMGLKLWGDRSHVWLWFDLNKQCPLFLIRNKEKVSQKIKTGAMLAPAGFTSPA